MSSNASKKKLSDLFGYAGPSRVELLSDGKIKASTDKQVQQQNQIIDNPPIADPAECDDDHEPDYDQDDGADLLLSQPIQDEEDESNIDRHQQVPDAVPPPTPLRSDSERYERLRDYIDKFHKKDLHRAVFESQREREQKNMWMPAYHVVIRINAIQFLDYDAPLGNELLSDSHGPVFEEIRRVCYKTLKNLIDGDETAILLERVRLSLRLEYLPDIDSCSGGPFTNVFASSILALQNAQLPPLVSLHGQTLSTGPQSFKTVCQTFRCDNSLCRSRDFLHYLPEAKNFKVIKRSENFEVLQTSTKTELHDIDLKCSHCARPMIELMSDRIFEAHQVIRVVISDVTEGAWFKALDIIMTEELVNTVNLGEYLEIVGSLQFFPGKSGGYSSYYLLANSVLKKALTCSSLDPTLTNAIDTLCNKPYIKGLVEANLSPYVYSQRLLNAVTHIMDDVPSSQWSNLRLALLLSLVSVPSDPSLLPEAIDMESGNDHRKSVNVLVVSKSSVDCPLLKRVFSSMGNLRKFVEVHYDKRLENFESNTTLMKWAGLAFESRDGVLFANLNFMKKGPRESLLSILKGTTASSANQKARNQAEDDFEFILWSTYHVQVKSVGRRFNSEEVLIRDSSIQQMLSHFDVIYELEDVTTADEIISSHILAKWMDMNGDSTNDLVTTDGALSWIDLADYIHIASNIHIKKMDDDCKALLKGYIIASKRYYFGGVSSEKLAILPSMESLARLATSHARLCLRDTVTLDDGIVSIVLIEDSMGPKFGMRLVGRMLRENPESIVIPDETAIPMSFEAQNKLWDQDLTDFYERCIHAIQNYVPDYSFENGGCSVRDLDETASRVGGGSELGNFDFGRF